MIPSIKATPIKCLRKWYDDTLTDKNNISSTEHQAGEWLRKIDRSGLPGKYKCWIYQHGLLPRLMWLLTVYEVPITLVEGLERSFNKHLRRWLGIPPEFYICRALHKVWTASAPFVFCCRGVQGLQVQTLLDILGLSRPTHQRSRNKNKVWVEVGCQHCNQPGRMFPQN